MTAGRTIGGRYELLNLVGQGSMGAVWRARDVRSGAVVAIKILHSFLATDRELVRRFEREGRMDVRSPHVVRTLDSGRDCGELFIVMEFVEGTSLKTMLESGALAAERASAIAAQIAAALAAIHARGIIHRDVKPGNILIASDGNARLSDMGIARVADSTTHTQTGVFLGSLTYAAPETFRGEWDERSDLYSLGVVLYEMLEGNPPFDGDPSRMMDQHRRSAPPELDDLERRFGTLGALVGALMEKQPQDRPDSAEVVVNELASSTGERTTIILPPAKRGRDAGPRAFRPIIVAGGALGAVVLALVVVMAWLSGGSTGDDAAALSATTPQSDITATAIAAYADAVSTSEARASATAAANAFIVAAATVQAPQRTPTVQAPPPEPTVPVIPPTQPSAAPTGLPPASTPPATPQSAFAGRWDVLMTLVETNGNSPLGRTVNRTFTISQNCRVTPCFVSVTSTIEPFAPQTITGTTTLNTLSAAGNFHDFDCDPARALIVTVTLDAQAASIANGRATELSGSFTTRISSVAGFPLQCYGSENEYEVRAFRVD